MNQPALGRIEVIDERDKNFPVSSILAEVTNGLPPIAEKNWWADGWWGNQGRNPYCVAYSWMHFLEDGPVIQDGVSESRAKPFFVPHDFYSLCQLHDQWDGEDYEGTSVRAGAKILKHNGVIESYRWARNVDEVITTIKYIGPVVTGTKWYANMSSPSRSGILQPTGEDRGGHAYIIDGCDDDTGMLRMKNSWGRGWGNNGFGYIRYEDFDTLLENGGEACIPFENKMNAVPNLLFS